MVLNKRCLYSNENKDILFETGVLPDEYAGKDFYLKTPLGLAIAVRYTEGLYPFINIYPGSEENCKLIVSAPYQTPNILFSMDGGKSALPSDKALTATCDQAGNVTRFVICNLGTPVAKQYKATQ